MATRRKEGLKGAGVLYLHLWEKIQQAKEEEKNQVKIVSDATKPKEETKVDTEKHVSLYFYGMEED